MAKAVLDLDIENLPPEITRPEHYQRAFILIRLRAEGPWQAPRQGGRLA